MLFTRQHILHSLTVVWLLAVMSVVAMPPKRLLPQSANGIDLTDVPSATTTTTTVAEAPPATTTVVEAPPAKRPRSNTNAPLPSVSMHPSYDPTASSSSSSSSASIPSLPTSPQPVNLKRCVTFNPAQLLPLNPIHTLRIAGMCTALEQMQLRLLDRFHVDVGTLSALAVHHHGHRVHITCMQQQHYNSHVRPVHQAIQQAVRNGDATLAHALRAPSIINAFNDGHLCFQIPINANTHPLQWQAKSILDEIAQYTDRDVDAIQEQKASTAYARLLFLVEGVLNAIQALHKLEFDLGDLHMKDFFTTTPPKEITSQSRPTVLLLHLARALPHTMTQGGWRASTSTILTTVMQPYEEPTMRYTAPEYYQSASSVHLRQRNLWSAGMVSLAVLYGPTALPAHFARDPAVFSQYIDKWTADLTLRALSTPQRMADWAYGVVDRLTGTLRVNPSERLLLPAAARVASRSPSPDLRAATQASNDPWYDNFLDEFSDHSPASRSS